MPTDKHRPKASDACFPVASEAFTRTDDTAPDAGTQPQISSSPNARHQVDRLPRREEHEGSPGSESPVGGHLEIYAAFPDGRIKLTYAKEEEVP
jgi:hypothetical protein